MSTPDLLNSALISAVISAVVSAAMGLAGTIWAQRRQELAALDDAFHELNRLAIEYPFLESDTFAAAWRPDAPEDDARLRYESYCCALFNLLERVWKHYGGDREQIEGFVGMRELVARHRRWWARPGDPTSNIRGYDEGFRRLVEQYVHEARRQENAA